MKTATLAICAMVCFSAGSWSAESPLDQVGKNFWLGHKSGGADVEFYRNDNGQLQTGIYLEPGTRITIDSYEPNPGSHSAYRVHTDDGQQYLLSADQFRFQRDMHPSDDDARSQGLYPKPEELILQDELAAQKAAAAAAHRRALAAAAQRKKDFDAMVQAAQERAARPRPAIGMTATEARTSSWGPPGHINRTTTIAGTKEQWVYDDDRFLYFDDGILTGIQDRGY